MFIKFDTDFRKLNIPKANSSVKKIPTHAHTKSTDSYLDKLKDLLDQRGKDTTRYLDAIEKQNQIRQANKESVKAEQQRQQQEMEQARKDISIKRLRKQKILEGKRKQGH